MTKKTTVVTQVLRFHTMLAEASLDLPIGYRDVNPFRGPQSESVRRTAAAFYRKFYDDSRRRRLILGSSPARNGTAVTGVPFEDATFLEGEVGATGDGYAISRASGGFLQDVIGRYGGREEFYGDFCMGFVCPLGIVKTSRSGNEVNCNYYESKELRRRLLPFIVDTLKCQLGFGVDASVCYCIGSGENFRFLSKINSDHDFFRKIVPLEHPRFVTQYNPGRRGEFVEKYLGALRDGLGCRQPEGRE